MGRVIKTIEIEGQPAKALFDTGAFHTYVLRRYLQNAPTRPVSKPYAVALGGETIEVREPALINGKIEGLDFDTSVVPVDSLGKANGHNLDAIIGAITMEALGNHHRSQKRLARPGGAPAPRIHRVLI